MLKKVEKTIKSYQMVDNNKPIIIGVSGGPDSMALLDVMSKILTNKLIVAHLNHQFRGRDAEEDAEFVKNECEKRGIKVVVKSINVPLYMKRTGLGAQEAAREVRYQFYRDVAREWNARIIALGHHANDQAETIMMRIIRGTGIHGLAGIPYTRDFEGLKIVRPLLDVTREEIENYCKKNSISYRTDKSNFSTKYFRNEVRLNILPYLEKYNYKITSHLHQIAKVIQDEDRYLNKIAEEFLAENMINERGDTNSLNISSLQKLDIALQRRVIYLILRYLNLNQELTYIHIDGIMRLINQKHPSKSIDLPGVRVYRDYDQIIFTPVKERGNKPYSYQLTVPGDVELDEVNKKIIAYVTKKPEEPSGVWAVFDYNQLKNKKLIIRSRNAGDRIEILGLGGSKKVKDIFIDEKISKEYRDLQPILECDGEILWIPGIRRSKHALISESTEDFLYVVFIDQ
ncbi:tRNA lysidine(34) synthetase TilS [Vulcanibacillus modesticaldus]|uniref:tRNA(Ile)-lysidine synthase n=1 Tax=Vulcanibacillus modesticaldus TaxID=337097 RepID=A0A1D2YXD2_9BACI|nr:tRNA lysidine(34) synthetase TilS [Vulcanibacillus modesticaldus]OEG00310.1 tRNA lysidine(34) synthetase TilS [Vulcanibacillus modesticaldus]